MKNHQVKLIDSIYTLKDAKEVVQSLIYDKINFLNRKIFSIQERFGSDTSHQERRVMDLKESLTHLSNFLESLEKEDSLVDINCQVELKVKNSETVEV